MSSVLTPGREFKFKTQFNIIFHNESQQKPRSHSRDSACPNLVDKLEKKATIVCAHKVKPSAFSSKHFYAWNKKHSAEEKTAKHFRVDATLKSSAVGPMWIHFAATWRLFLLHSGGFLSVAARHLRDFTSFGCVSFVVRYLTGFFCIIVVQVFDNFSCLCGQAFSNSGVSRKMFGTK